MNAFFNFNAVPAFHSELEFISYHMTLAAYFFRACDTEPESIKTEEKGCQARFAFFDQIKNVDQLTACTGLNSFELFESLLAGMDQFCRTRKSNVLTGQLSLRDQLCLTLMKLKQNLTFTLLSVFFEVHRTTCARIFTSTLLSLRVILQNFIPSVSTEKFT